MAQTMWKSMDIIQEDDIVILHETFKKVDFIRVKAGQVYQNKFGAFHHNDMIGSPYGSKLVARKSNGHLYLLAPTPELWSKALPHRTQIVFTSDAASIVFNLQLKPGCKVGEAGTGSGSLSTAFMRTIAPTGYLYTFEFNQTRAEKAALEFQQNGISDFVKVEHRDVCENGFPEGLELDAVFLDLPKPWVAVPYADKVLKKQGRIASYSPCLEQVQRTCKALQENGFSRIRTIETRQIPYDARKVSLPIPSFEVATDKAPGNNVKRKKIDPNVIGRDAKVYAVKELEMRGHTAFLTYAVKYDGEQFQ